MTPDEMREILAPRPFKPVRVFLKDGKYYDITHPQLKLIGPSSLYISKQWAGSDEPVGDESYIIGWEVIDRVEVLEPSQTGSA
jgi:hypothetical protein